MFFLFCGVAGQLDHWAAGHQLECEPLSFAVGEAIVVRGLVSAASLNGRKGTVLGLQKEKGRVMVRLAAVGDEPERDVCAKPANLERG